MTSPTNNPSECPVDQVEQLARGPQDQPIPPELCQHLEQCAACRARLEAAAAPELDWARVRRVLKIQPLPEQDNAAKVGLNFSLLRLLSPSDDPAIVGKIGPFEITEVIGSGGMGLVLKGRDPALDRFVAVKILAPHLASSPTARRRFGREARAAAAVIHDNVIAIYQVSEHHELPYLVMPYLPDPSLQQRLDLQGKLDLESALSIALQVANGLQAAHSQGLIHRDIKPANVLLAKGTERAIITDFGLARAADDASLTSSGILAGTPHYMSPEQARGETVDARSDLFSLGSLIYAMVSGNPPVNRELASETIRVIAAEPMPRLKTVAPDAPDWVDRLVAWLHQTAPENRPQSAHEISEVLEQCLIHLRQPESHPLPERLTSIEDPAMANPKDNRLFSLIALFLFLGTLVSPALIAMTTRDEYALVFGAICGVLALAFAFLSWSEPISRGVAKTLGGLILAGCIGLVGLFAIWEFRGNNSLRLEAELRKAQAAERAAMAGAREKQEAKIGKNKNDPGTDEENKKSQESQASDLKWELGEDEPIPEWKKPKVVPLPQLTGTWVASKAYLNGEEFKSKEKDQKIWLVSYGDSLLLQVSRGFRDTPELHLGAGTIRLVPGKNSNLFMINLDNLESANKGRYRRPIFATFDLKEESLSIAFSENIPSLSPGKGRDFFEFQRFSQRYPKHLEPTIPIESKSFFCSSGESKNPPFPTLIGSWISEKTQFGRKASQEFSKLDPTRFCLLGNGYHFSLLFAPVPSSSSDGQPVKDQERTPHIPFPQKKLTFYAWNPSGTGPIQARLFTNSHEVVFINLSIKESKLELTIADTLENLMEGRENDFYIFQKLTNDDNTHALNALLENRDSKNGLSPRANPTGKPKTANPVSPRVGLNPAGAPEPVKPIAGPSGESPSNPPTASVSLAEQLKPVLGEDQPPPAWKKAKPPVLPQLVGTWLATKAFVNGKEMPVADAQNQANQRVWLVAYGDYLCLTQAALPDYDPDKTTFLGAGNPYPYFGNNDQSGWFFKMNIFDGLKIREERNKLTNGTPGISPVFPSHKPYNFIYSRFEIKDGTLRIAFSENTPRLEGAKNQQYFEFKRLSEKAPLSLHAMREQDLVTVPFQSIQGDYEPAIVPAIVGTWKIETARFQGKDLLAKQSFENLILVSNGSELMLLDAPSPKSPGQSKLASLGRLISWDPVNKGSFQLHTQAVRLSSEGKSIGSKDFELATGRATLQGDKLEILFSPTLAGEQNRENYLVAKRIPNDPVLNLNFPLEDNFKLLPFPFSKRLKQKTYFWNLENPINYPFLKDIVDIRKLSQTEKLALLGTPFPEITKRPVAEKKTTYFTLEVLSGIPRWPREEVTEILDHLEDCGILCKDIGNLGRPVENQGFVATVHLGDTISLDQAKEIRSKIEPLSSRIKNLTVHFIKDDPGKPGKILESIEPKTASLDKGKQGKDK